MFREENKVFNFEIRSKMFIKLFRNQLEIHEQEKIVPKVFIFENFEKIKRKWSMITWAFLETCRVWNVNWVYRWAIQEYTNANGASPLLSKPLIMFEQTTYYVFIFCNSVMLLMGFISIFSFNSKNYLIMTNICQKRTKWIKTWLRSLIKDAINI